MILYIVGFCAVAVFCLALPLQALAWGPGVHMVTGNWLLQNLAGLPPEIAAALMQHPGQFLHGILSADIFIGKGCKAKKGHSHNWESGFTLLARAKSGGQRAYAYGYLAHLAADVVAHNVYVPGLLPAVPGRGKASHIYLEIQADRMLSWDSEDALGVFHEKSSRKSLAMLRQAMQRRSLPFWLNTRIFQGSIALGGSRWWRGSLLMLDKLFRPCGQISLLERMLSISTRAMVDLLQKGQDSRILSFDPIGAESLASANGQRKKLLPSDAAAPFPRKNFPESELAGLCAEAPLPVIIPSLLDSLPSICSPDENHHE